MFYSYQIDLYEITFFSLHILLIRFTLHVFRINVTSKIFHMFWYAFWSFIIFHIIFLSFWSNKSIFLLSLSQTLIIYSFFLELCNLVAYLSILQDVFLFFLWSDTFLEYFDRFLVTKYFIFLFFTFLTILLSLWNIL